MIKELENKLKEKDIRPTAMRLLVGCPDQSGGSHQPF